MEISLYNNHEQYIKEIKQDYRIDSFCRDLKISLTKLESHPNIADVRTLLDFRPYQTYMTDKDQQILRHTWAWVYHKELPLNTYHKRKLNTILNSIEYRQQHMKKAITMTSKKGRSLPDLTNRSGLQR